VSITAKSQTATKKVPNVFTINYPNSQVSCVDAPSAVCMIESEYREMRKAGKILEIERAMPAPPCPSCPDVTKDYLIIGGVSFSLGVLLSVWALR